MAEHFNRGEILRCAKLEKYEIKGPAIFRGVYGRLYAICELQDRDDPTCAKKIVKIVLDRTADERLDADREAFVLGRLSDSGITPRLFHAFRCSGYRYFVMERFDVNMLKLGKEQAEKKRRRIERLLPAKVSFRRVVLWTEAQFLRMFELALQLSLRYVIHGDLKPDQFLYRRSDKKMAVTDFGFSGVKDSRFAPLPGWSHYSEDCYQPLAADAVNYRYYNLYQLWSYFKFGDDLVLIQRGRSLYYLKPLGAYFHKGHRYHVPTNMLRRFSRNDSCGEEGPAIPRFFKHIKLEPYETS